MCTFKLTPFISTFAWQSRNPDETQASTFCTSAAEHWVEKSTKLQNRAYASHTVISLFNSPECCAMIPRWKLFFRVYFFKQKEVNSFHTFPLLKISICPCLYPNAGSSLLWIRCVCIQERPTPFLCLGPYPICIFNAFLLTTIINFSLSTIPFPSTSSLLFYLEF